MAYFITNSGDKIFISSDIEFTMYSPIGFISGKHKTNSFSMPFTIPSTPEYDIIVERAGEVDARNNKIRLIEGKLIVDVLIFAGILRVTKTDTNGYSSTFVGQKASYRDLNSANMNELDLGTVLFPFDFYDQERLTIDKYYFDEDGNTGGDEVYCIPMYENFKYIESFPFTLSYPNEYNKIVNYFPKSSATRISLKNNPFAILSPMFMLNYVVNKICTFIGFNVIENAFAKDLLKDVILFSNYSIKDIYFTKWVESPSTQNLSINEIIVDENEVKIKLSPAPPFGTYTNGFWIMHDIVSPGAANMENRVILMSSWDSGSGYAVIDIDPEDIISYSGYSGKISYMLSKCSIPDSLNINRHLPEMTALDFFDILEHNFAVAFVPDEAGKNIRIRLMKDILNSTDYTDISDWADKLINQELVEYSGYKLEYIGEADDYYDKRISTIRPEHNLKDNVNTLTDLPLTGNANYDIRYVESERVYFIWDENIYGVRVVGNNNVSLGNWRFFSEPYIAIESGENEMDIDIESAPIPRRYSTYIFKTICRADVEGNTSYTRSYTDAGIRFMFLKGMDGDLAVTSDEGVNISLGIKGSKGLYELLYKEVVYWLIDRARTVTSHVHWPKHLLNSFRWDKKYRIKGTNYLIKSIQMTIRENDFIEFRETELVRT